MESRLPLRLPSKPPKTNPVQAMETRDEAGFGSDRTFHQAHLLGLRKLCPCRSFALRKLCPLRAWLSASSLDIQHTRVKLVIELHKLEGMRRKSLRPLVVCDDARELTGAQQLKDICQAPLFCDHALRHHFRPQNKRNKKA